jgi:Sulfotransferase family
MVKVLYVMGLYRSGSTILDIVLANHPAMVGVGELRNLAYHVAGRPETCACGNPVERCSFWRAVQQRWREQAGGDALARFAALEERFERIRALPAVFLARVMPSSAFTEYVRLTATLYEAIAAESGREIVVDSSKYPARALALLFGAAVDLRIVHLVRDGRAVIWSMRRKESTEMELAASQVAPHTSRQWLLTNLTSGLVTALAGERAIRVRYEDFVTNPREQLSRIGALAGVDMRDLVRRVLEGDSLDVAHTVAGNRVRMGGRVTLRMDDEWKSRLAPADREVFWRKAGWLAVRYGYPEQ